MKRPDVELIRFIIIDTEEIFNFLEWQPYSTDRKKLKVQITHLISLETYILKKIAENKRE